MHAGLQYMLTFHLAGVQFLRMWAPVTMSTENITSRPIIGVALPPINNYWGYVAQSLCLHITRWM